jgi:cytochrome c oxidase subunit 4
MSKTDAQHESSVVTYTLIYVWLMLLMILTIVAARFDLGGANLLVALLIAAIKALLVVLFFMHVKYGGKVVWMFSGAAFLWLGIMLTLTMSDYVSRTWVPRRLADQPSADIFRRSPPPPTPTVELRGTNNVRPWEMGIAPTTAPASH